MSSPTGTASSSLPLHLLVKTLLDKAELSYPQSSTHHVNLVLNERVNFTDNNIAVATFRYIISRHRDSCMSDTSRNKQNTANPIVRDTGRSCLLRYAVGLGDWSFDPE